MSGASIRRPGAGAIVTDRLHRELARVDLAIADTEHEYRRRGSEIDRLQYLQAQAITAAFTLRAEKRRIEAALVQSQLSIPVVAEQLEAVAS